MKRTPVSWVDVMNMTQEILRQLHQDGWRPDYVVGLTRGGLTPANLISQYLDVPMETLKVSLRDGGDCETNCWMATDAWEGRNILIVDDINDSGATLNWIRDDWSSGCLPNDPKWQEIWHSNVKVAVLIDNESSNNEIPVTYSARSINKAETPEWIVFPWENWWQRDKGETPWQIFLMINASSCEPAGRPQMNSINLNTNSTGN